LDKKHSVSFTVGEMPVESSRGCWYGQKVHCTFCGIDDETLRYRVKSASVTVAQLDELHERYNVQAFRFSDYIMPLAYYDTLLPLMAQRGAPYTLHYETKANLKEQQIDRCAAAGIRYLQPGIESFSTPVLKLMGKGVTAAQNIFTLCTMFSRGIYMFYNLIFGFPFETADDYEAMTNLLPALYHLVPPQTTVPVLVTRYAPLATDPVQFGASGPLRAHWRYDVIFSRKFREESGLEMRDYCYYFESPYRDFSPELKLSHTVLQHQVLNWRQRFESGKASLTWTPDGRGTVISDTRSSDEPVMRYLDETHSLVGEILRSGLYSEVRLMAACLSHGVAPDDARQAVEHLLATRTVLRVDGFLVWLPTPPGCFDDARTVEPERANRAIRASEDWPPVVPLRARTVPSTFTQIALRGA